MMNAKRFVLFLFKDDDTGYLYGVLPICGKCEFLSRSIAFCGHTISREPIDVYPRNTEAVKNWPRSLTPTYIRCFFCLVGDCRKFLDVFASTTSPLM